MPLRETKKPNCLLKHYQCCQGKLEAATRSGFLYLSPHMSNTLNQIPVDKTWCPMESGRKMKPEVQSSPLELQEV